MQPVAVQPWLSRLLYLVAFALFIIGLVAYPQDTWRYLLGGLAALALGLAVA